MSGEPTLVFGCDTRGVGKRGADGRTLDCILARDAAVGACKVEGPGLKLEGRFSEADAPSLDVEVALGLGIDARGGPIIPELRALLLSNVGIAPRVVARPADVVVDIVEPDLCRAAEVDAIEEFREEADCPGCGRKLGARLDFDAVEEEVEAVGGFEDLDKKLPKPFVPFSRVLEEDFVVETGTGIDEGDRSCAGSAVLTLGATLTGSEDTAAFQTLRTTLAEDLRNPNREGLGLSTIQGEVRKCTDVKCKILTS